MKRINALIKDMQKNLFEGIGKPEPLKGNCNGWWSRHINEKNRIVYRGKDGMVIASCKRHYND